MCWVLCGAGDGKGCGWGLGTGGLGAAELGDGGWERVCVHGCSRGLMCVCVRVQYRGSTTVKKKINGKPNEKYASFRDYLVQGMWKQKHSELVGKFKIVQAPPEATQVWLLAWWGGGGALHRVRFRLVGVCCVCGCEDGVCWVWCVCLCGGGDWVEQ